MNYTDAKLTLKLNSSAIESAKAYAESQGESLSRIVERLFIALSATPPSPRAKPGSIVAELSGVLKLPPDFDYKKSYGEHLEKKYLH